MIKLNRLNLSLVAAIIGFTGLGFVGWNTVGAEPTANSPVPKPVEDDMHEFMEYVFQLPYQRLRENMKSEPTQSSGWMAIKSDSLILAEGGNLLLIRGGGDDPAAWNEHAEQVRALGGQLYDTAKQKDFKAARGHYETLLNKCNSCHNKFADGEHQLKP